MVKIGIIGCGGMGRLHSNILKKMEDVEITAASDINKNQLLSFQKDFEVKKVFIDYKELLKLSEIDGIICSTPTFTHSEIVIEAANAKKDIFCEKPISLNLKDAEKMVEECEKNNVKFQIGYVRRFDDEWLKFRELMKSKIIGSPVVWRQISAGPGPSSLWYYDINKGGGPFIDGAVHSYDFGIYTFGKVKNVESSLTRFKKFSSPDTGTVCVEFENGDILVVCWSWGLPENCSGNRIHEVIGPEGVLIFEGIKDEKNKWFLLRKENGKEEKIEKLPLNTLEIAYEKQMEHFIDCIKNNKKPIVGGKEGIETLKVGLEAIKKWKT
ncbi:Gfo/Idh/MocA family oxidoreductase [bacterium]|nr:Gfo/Idh/MocA family oxidoreductase [bacterium]